MGRLLKIYCIISLQVICLTTNADTTSFHPKYDFGISFFSARHTNPSYNGWQHYSNLRVKLLHGVQFRKFFDERNGLRVFIDHRTQRQETDRSFYSFITNIEKETYYERSLSLAIGYQRSFALRKKKSIYFFIDVIEGYKTFKRTGKYLDSYFPVVKEVDHTSYGNIKEVGGSFGLGFQKNFVGNFGFNLEVSVDAVFSKKNDLHHKTVSDHSHQIVQPINRFVFSYRI